MTTEQNIIDRNFSPGDLLQFIRVFGVDQVPPIENRAGRIAKAMELGRQQENPSKRWRNILPSPMPRKTHNPPTPEQRTARARHAANTRYAKAKADTDQQQEFPL